MKKVTATFLILAAALAPSGLFAHDLGIAYERRGECEAALARVNNSDRATVHEITGETPGELNRFFHETFECRKDGDFWYIVFAD